MRFQVMRLYVVPGVPEETAFETRTKKEIGEIAWHKIKDLPTSKEDAQGKLKPFWCVWVCVNAIARRPGLAFVPSCYVPQDGRWFHRKVGQVARKARAEEEAREKGEGTRPAEAAADNPSNADQGVGTGSAAAAGGCAAGRCAAGGRAGC